jgi:DNA-binding MarR family transcriptional regulator
MKEERYKALYLENQLCFPLYACAKEVTRQYRPFLDRYGLTYTQYIALLVLWEYGPMRLDELGEKLMLDSGTLTPLLKKLEDKGYLIREKDPEDKRNLILSVSEKGFALREEALAIPGQIGSCLHLSKEEALTLYHLLYKTINNMKESA